MLRELGIDDQLHYWFISGDQTAAIEWELVLAQEVEKEALTRAVVSAMEIHTHFCSPPGSYVYHGECLETRIV